MPVELAVEIASVLLVIKECGRLNIESDVTQEIRRLLILLDGYIVDDIYTLEMYCLGVIHESYA